MIYQTETDEMNSRCQVSASLIKVYIFRMLCLMPYLVTRVCGKIARRVTSRYFCIIILFKERNSYLVCFKFELMFENSTKNQIH